MAFPFSAFDRKTTATPVGASAAAAVWLAAAAAAAGLDDPVRASWRAVPLRDWAARVAPLAGVPVIVDRRIDPDTPVTLDCDGEPVREALARAAAAADAEVALLRGSVRIVPRGQGELCERAEAARGRDVARLPAAARTTVQQRRAWAWPEAARPRDLVAAAAEEAGLPLEGAAGLPHDHFPAADLPALSLAERLDLVLAHFDRRVEWRTEAGALRAAVVPLDKDLPPPRSQRPPRPAPATTREPRGQPKNLYSLRVEAPLAEALTAVAGRLGLELDLDDASLRARGIAPGEIVRLDVRDLSRDALLDRLVAPLALAWRIEANRLRVFAPPAAEAPE